MVSAVIFDLDDTLISEYEYQVSAREAVIDHLTYRTGIPRAIISAASDQALSVPREQYFQTMMTSLELKNNEGDVSELLSIHREHTPTIQWYPDVLSSLHELRLLGAKLGIITDGYQITQRRKLSALRASEYFDEIVVSDELGRDYWKPHPKPFLRIADKLSVRVSEMIYVGDNPEKDFFISSELPIRTIRMIREDALKGHLSYRDGIRENYIARNMGQVVKIFESLRGNVANRIN